MTEQDKMVFCTLFDSNYLDKGLALYKSMRKHIDAFRLYIFAFDDKCFDILSAMRLKNVIVLSVEDIMTETMQRIKGERTQAEFCWTSTPVIIEHVLVKYQEEICTYIDADIFFWANPAPVIQEIIDAVCSVGLVEHKFERNATYGESVLKYGRYCIQFNTFLNNKEGRRVLRDWKEDCLNWCYDRYEDGRFGDQKYTDKWQQKYSGVHASTYIGAGVAPWNLHMYTDIHRKNGGVWMKFRNKPFQVIFYHYAGMKCLSTHRICLNLWKYGKFGTGRKIRVLYGGYFAVIMQIREKLQSCYDITFEHMIDYDGWYAEKKYSLKRLCKDEGIFRGLIGWIAYWKNNILFVTGIF